MDKVTGKKVAVAIADGLDFEVHELYGRLWVIDPRKRRTVDGSVYRSLNDVRRDYEVRECR